MEKVIIGLIVGVVAIDISVAISVVFQSLAKKGVKFFENVKARMAVSFGIGFILFLIAMGVLL